MRQWARGSTGWFREGDTIKSRTTHQDFLALWKDADPDIQILKRAKAEYAKLNSCLIVLDDLIQCW